KELEGKIYRYVNAPDPVPRLPTMSLLANEYLHCEKEMALGTGAGLAEFFKGMVSKSADGLLSGTLLSDLWAGVMHRISAPFMPRSRKRPENLPGGTA